MLSSTLNLVGQLIGRTPAQESSDNNQRENPVNGLFQANVANAQNVNPQQQVRQSIQGEEKDEPVLVMHNQAEPKVGSIRSRLLLADVQPNAHQVANAPLPVVFDRGEDLNLDFAAQRIEEEEMDLEFVMVDGNEIEEPADKHLLLERYEILKRQFGELHLIDNLEERRQSKWEIGQEMKEIREKLSPGPKYCKQSNLSLLKELIQDIEHCSNRLIAAPYIRQCLRLNREGFIIRPKSEEIPFQQEDFKGESGAKLLASAVDWEKEYLSRVRQDRISIDDPEFRTKIIDFISGIWLRSMLLKKGYFSVKFKKKRTGNQGIVKYHNTSAMQKSLNNAKKMLPLLKRIDATRWCDGDFSHKDSGDIILAMMVKLIANNQPELAGAVSRRLMFTTSYSYAGEWLRREKIISPDKLLGRAAVQLGNHGNRAKARLVGGWVKDPKIQAALQRFFDAGCRNHSLPELDAENESIFE